MKLLRTSLVCLMLGLGMVPALAQKGLKIGGFFLPQASVLYNEDDFNLDEDEYQMEILPGMAGGLLFGYHFNDIIGVRMNVIYSQEGGRYSARRDFSGRDMFTTRLEYLKVPVMVGFNTSPKNNKIMFAAYAGVQGNMLVRGYTYGSNPVYVAPSPEGAYRLPSTKDLYEQWTYSAVLDMGVDIFLTRKATFNLRVRGDLGLTDSEDKSVSYLYRDGGASDSNLYWDWARGANAKAETYPLNVGLLFGLTYTLSKSQEVAMPPAMN
ncbi:MAG: PorT family protein [Bacteroidia bacterium]|nr:PorT family protein [Bacteroidia bacterium]